ncbi:hypothetical protein HDU78_010302 [Chytriomyces hyalinus]|nr:hypothetical protein HDU78_010302 [Chytriomyces hyalinus]
MQFSAAAIIAVVASVAVAQYDAPKATEVAVAPAAQATALYSGAQTVSVAAAVAAVVAFAL